MRSALRALVLSVLAPVVVVLTLPGYAQAKTSQPKTVPAVVGKRLDKALKTLKHFDKKAPVAVTDAVGHRRVGNKKNWLVLTEDPQAGSPHAKRDPIHLQVRKETDRKDGSQVPASTTSTTPTTEKPSARVATTTTTIRLSTSLAPTTVVPPDGMVLPDATMTPGVADPAVTQANIA